MTPPRLRLRHLGMLGLLLVSGATMMGPGPVHLGPPHVLLITLDTVRADHCSVYGYGRPTTPTLERLAREGVVFEQAYAPMATTAPAHASLFTGLAPARHGVDKNGLVLADRFETLAERLAAAGYDTAAVVSSFAVHGKFGLQQGFATYDDDFKRAANPHRWQWEGHVHQGTFDRDARLTTERSIRWLRSERDRRRPFFLWVHYFDPHDPFDPPPPYDRLFVTHDSATADADDLEQTIARYDAEIRETDDAIGRLLAELEAQELSTATLVVVAGDHGEGLMDHNWMHHGLQLYEESVRVPLVVRWPARIPAAQRLRGPVLLQDIAPTILELTGSPPGPRSAERPGTSVSLVPAMTGTTKLARERPIFLQRRRYRGGQRHNIPVRGEKHAVRVERWKYIEAPEEHTYELYDLIRDPGETRNLATSKPAHARRLATQIAEWHERGEGQHTPRPVPDADAARLRSLGYVD